MSARRLARGLAAALAPLALCACKGVQTMLDPAGQQARDIDLIWRAMLAVCGVMYLLVLGFLAWALWRARTRGPQHAGPPEPGVTAAEPALERSLTGWVALVTAGLVLLTTVSFLVDRSLAEVGPDPLRVIVTANQWWWDVNYVGRAPSENLRTANELHLPLGRPAIIELHANDVIHSFWAPNFNGKTDLIPGRINYIAITPKRLGRFRGQCAEFCGLEHAKMAFDIVVDRPAAFDAWRKQQIASAQDPASLEAVEGKQVFVSKACVMCHRIQGTDASGMTGPDLTHLMSRTHIAAGALSNSRGDLAAWISDPQGIKPGTTMPRVDLTSDELNSVTAYLETLK
jgi:cytochrome c oxidase subunit 2